ncbi:MAG: fructose-bisphosphatase class II, partial [Bartonella sp.]|nr:fructose-bisphosphatase class II [Bartonella sp.]
QGRLQLNTEEQIARAAQMGIKNPNKVYTMEEMAKGDVLFAATGVTDGNMLSGVKFTRDYIQTDSLVMRSHTGTIRNIKAQHRNQ